MKAIIVDDEESARLTLRSILTEFFKEVVIVGEADSPGDAVQLIEEKHPDIVFLDIQMRMGTGFDVLEALDQQPFQVIFISAHKQHAYDSFRFNAVDYLLKPVRIKDLRVAIDKAKENVKVLAPGESALLRQVTLDQTRLQLVIPELEGFSVLSLAEIVFCEGSRNYTEFSLSSDRKITATRTIKDFEDLLIPNGFLRIHRSHIINLYHVRKYVKGRGGVVMMSNGAELTVARERKDELVETFLKP